eukprot:196343_1
MTAVLIVRATTFWFLLSRCQTQSCFIDSSLPRGIFAHETAYDPVSHCAYLFGGSGPTDGAIPIDTIYKRNMDQTDWTTLSVSTPTSMFYSITQNSVLIDRIVYFIGMYDTSYQSGKLYKFDIITEDWASNNQLTPPTHPSIFGCLTGNETHLFMIGGRSCDSCYDEYLQIYDINANSWFTEAIDVSPVKGNGWLGQYCHMVDNELYVFGGFVGGGIGYGHINGIFKYDQVDKWSVLPSTLPSSARSGATIYKHPFMYLVGGWDGVNSLNTIVEFDINTESITNTHTMEEGIRSMGAEIVNNKVYIFGGRSTSGDSSLNVEQCDIYTTSDPSIQPSQQPSYMPSTTPSEPPSDIPSNEPTIPTTADPTTNQTTFVSDITSIINTRSEHVQETETETENTGNDNDNIEEAMDWLLYVEIIVVSILMLFTCFCVYIVCRYYKQAEQRKHAQKNQKMVQKELQHGARVVNNNIPIAIICEDERMENEEDSIDSLYVKHVTQEQMTIEDSSKQDTK